MRPPRLSPCTPYLWAIGDGLPGAAERLADRARRANGRGAAVAPQLLAEVLRTATWGRNVAQLVAAPLLGRAPGAAPVAAADALPAYDRMCAAGGLAFVAGSAVTQAVALPLAATVGVVGSLGALLVGPALRPALQVAPPPGGGRAMGVARRHYVGCVSGVGHALRAALAVHEALSCGGLWATALLARATGSVAGALQIGAALACGLALLPLAAVLAGARLAARRRGGAPVSAPRPAPKPPTAAAPPPVPAVV